MLHLLLVALSTPAVATGEVAVAAPVSTDVTLAWTGPVACAAVFALWLAGVGIAMGRHGRLRR